MKKSLYNIDLNKEEVTVDNIVVLAKETLEQAKQSQDLNKRLLAIRLMLEALSIVIPSKIIISTVTDMVKELSEMKTIQKYYEFSYYFTEENHPQLTQMIHKLRVSRNVEEMEYNLNRINSYLSVVKMSELDYNTASNLAVSIIIELKDFKLLKDEKVAKEQTTSKTDKETTKGFILSKDEVYNRACYMLSKDEDKSKLRLISLEETGIDKETESFKFIVEQEELKEMYCLKGTKTPTQLLLDKFTSVHNTKKLGYVTEQYIRLENKNFEDYDRVNLATGRKFRNINVSIKLSDLVLQY